MWDFTPTNLTDPTNFTALCTEYAQYYRDHAAQIEAMGQIISGLFVRAGLEDALPMAKASSMRGSLFLNLLWRPVYPFGKDATEYDPYVAFDYENNYAAELIINSNGTHDDYRFIICYNYRDEQGIYTTADKAIPFKEHQKLKLPDWFESNVRKIRDDILKKNSHKSFASKVLRFKT